MTKVNSKQETSLDEVVKMGTYRIQDREAGNVIERGLTEERANELIAKYEQEDQRDGTYTPDFYEIVEEEE